MAMKTTTNPKRLFLNCAMVWAFFGAAHTVGSQSDDPQNAAKAAILAQQANLDSFSSYTCRFRLSKAEAVSPEAAFRGEYLNVRQCEYLIVRDGDKEKFESFAPPPPKANPKTAPKAKDGKISISVDFIPFADLRLGNVGLSYFSPWQKADVMDEEDLRENQLPTPLTFGGIFGPKNGFAPSSLLPQVGNGRITMQSDGMIVLNQTPAIHARFTSTEFGKIDYNFDLQQGYLPVHVIQHLISPEGRQYPEYRARVLEAKKVSNNRWFPWHVVVAFSGEAKGQPVMVHDVQVLELDADKKPTDEDFRIELPANTRIQTPGTSKRDLHFRLRKAETISPADIPKLARMLEEHREPTLKDTAVDNGNPTLIGWLLTAVGVAFLGASIFLFRRVRAVHFR